MKFPSQGTVFDYFLDDESKKWLPWSEKVPKYVMDPEMPLQVNKNSYILILTICFSGCFSSYCRDDQISLFCGFIDGQRSSCYVSG